VNGGLILKKTRLFIDHDYGEFFTLDRLQREFENLKQEGLTESETFQDYLINVTGKNGTVTEASHLILCSGCFSNSALVTGLKVEKLTKENEKLLPCGLCGLEGESAGLVKITPVDD
jgi:hypothetical protein